MSEVGEIVLPTKVVKAERQSPKIMVLYSPPKAGKTTLLSKLDNNLILDLEDGTKFLDALKVKVENLEQFQKIGQQIIAAGKPYKYVTIDTISVLEEWCEDLATKNYMDSPMGKKFNRDAVGNIVDNKSVLTLPNGGGL